MIGSQIVLDGISFVGAAEGDVAAVITCRTGGASEGPFSSLNLSTSVGDDDARVAENRRRATRALGIGAGGVAFARQAHGTDALDVVGGAGGDCPLGAGDILVTGPEGPTLAIQVADCLAIVIADRRTGARGAAHAGWRGTVDGVAEALLSAMTERHGTQAVDCWAFLSPCIGPCCYRIGSDVDHPLKHHPSPGRYILKPDGDQQALDLRAENAARLIACGAPPESIFGSDLCTACREDLFFSHVRDRGRSGRMWVLIGRRWEHGGRMVADLLR